MKLIDIVVPCFNEEEVLNIFYNELKKTVSDIVDYKFRIIFIDDGSSDNTLSIIINLSEQDESIKYTSFSRNFGKEAAIYAGLKKSTGDYVVLIDADMQDPPSLIPQLISFIESGYDSAATRRVNRRGEAFLRSVLSTLFYRLINKISEVKIVEGARDFRIMTRKMVNAVVAMSEVQRFSKGIFSWVGFNTAWIDYENVERVAGKTKWSLFSLFKYAIEGITAFSAAPLKISSILGLFVSFISFLYLLFVFVRTLFWGIVIPGYASTIVTELFVGGMIMFSCGILGEYLSKIYLEVKRRPIYIEKLTNFEQPKDD